jgi:hypothetical protein
VDTPLDGPGHHDRSFNDWVGSLEQLRHDAPEQRLDRHLARAYESIESLLDEADQFQGVGDELEAAKRRAFAARQACSTLTTVAESEDWQRSLSVAEAVGDRRRGQVRWVVRVRPAWQTFVFVERRVLRSAGLSDGRAVRLLEGGRAACTEALNEPASLLSARTLSRDIEVATEEICKLANNLEGTYRKLSKQRRWRRVIGSAVGGVLLVVVDTAPVVASLGTLTPVGVATSTAVGSALLGRAMM